MILMGVENLHDRFLHSRALLDHGHRVEFVYSPEKIISKLLPPKIGQDYPVFDAIILEATFLDQYPGLIAEIRERTPQKDDKTVIVVFFTRNDPEKAKELIGVADGVVSFPVHSQDVLIPKDILEKVEASIALFV